MTRPMTWTTVGKAFDKTGASASQAAENPFRRGDDGKIPNPSKISQLIRTDFDHAMRLCREAGEPTSKWFDLNPR